MLSRGHRMTGLVIKHYNTQFHYEIYARTMQAQKGNECQSGRRWDSTILSHIIKDPFTFVGGTENATETHWCFKN